MQTGNLAVSGDRVRRIVKSSSIGWSAPGIAVVVAVVVVLANILAAVLIRCAAWNAHGPRLSSGTGMVAATQDRAATVWQIVCALEYNAANDHQMAMFRTRQFAMRSGLIVSNQEIREEFNVLREDGSMASGRSSARRAQGYLREVVVGELGRFGSS